MGFRSVVIRLIPAVIALTLFSLSCKNLLLRDPGSCFTVVFFYFTRIQFIFFFKCSNVNTAGPVAGLKGCDEQNRPSFEIKDSNYAIREHLKCFLSVRLVFLRFFSPFCRVFFRPPLPMGRGLVA